MSLLDVLDWFVPMDVLAAVLMVFALENVLAAVVQTDSALFWLAVYTVGVILVGAGNLHSADEEELNELEEDIRS